MNRLSDSKSPYLLQHKDNPVHWQPWDETALQAAKDQDKLLLISIGYSSCHWCHVMEHESFEDDSVADIMNAHFIPIKIDREERPDIDQVYMSAVQIMTGRGGWPLNCVALPDGRPIWGGTYFPKENWKSALSQLAELYEKDRPKVEEYAQKLQEGMQQGEQLTSLSDRALDKDILENALVNWRRRMDTVWGGPDKAPKFPLPNNHELLLDLCMDSEEEWLQDQVLLTLDKMALGGIYDQIGGGFARYSTDKEWKVPHFEKMLYDNAQLIRLYSRAFTHFNHPMYKRIVEESIQWALDEMHEENGRFYSALDADSEGEEGLFYTWPEEELHHIRENLPELQVDQWFQLDTGEEWEGRFILQRRQADRQAIDKHFDGNTPAFDEAWSKLKSEMLGMRSKRVRPGLDDKSLTSWNALMISGLCAAFDALGNVNYRKEAEKTFAFIKDQMMDDGKLLHAYNQGAGYGDAMLDDHVFLVRAAMDLHRVCGKDEYLQFAYSLTEAAIENFEDDDHPLFWFSTDSSLAVRTKENEDNVIPAANSQMARNLYELGLLFGKPEWMVRSREMLSLVAESLERYPEGYSNWAALLGQWTTPHYELAIVGPDAQEAYRDFARSPLANVLPIWSETASELPIFRSRWVEGKTLFYLCEKGACKMPVERLEEVRELLKADQ